MFNTTILDVAIGMIFIYLLLSLMCTAANEIIELALKKRAVDLERGIRELLAPGSASGADDVVRKLYNHALVNSLFGGKYEKSRIQNRIQRKLMRTALPSYIPSRTFALALMDLVLPGSATPPAGAGVAGAAAAPPATPSGTAGATPPPAKFEVKLAAPPPPQPPITDPNNPLARLRSAVGASPLLTPHAREALTPLIDAAGSDVAKARENIETWYDTTMDRVSSWYKRRTQVVLIFLGLFVAITVNADTIILAKRLSTDRPLRESMVAAAQDYARANASASPSPSPSPTSSPTPKTTETSRTTDTTKPPPTSTPAQAPTATPPLTSPTPPSDSGSTPQISPTATPPLPPPCVKDEYSADCEREQKLQRIPACVKDRGSDECKREENRLKILACGEKGDPAECKRLLKNSACAEDGDSAECKFEQDCGLGGGQYKDTPECKYRDSLRKIEGLGLPLGWDDKNDPKRNWTGWTLKGDSGGWRDQLYWHWLGWLLTALAISLGAPFWFDLLNKFIVIRSAVKPHEKSPEEESKD